MTNSKPKEEILIAPGQSIIPGAEMPKRKLVKRDEEMARGDLVVKKFTDAQMQIIRNTIAKGLTEDELAIFIYRARAYGLDPLKGEISAQVRNATDPNKRQMIVIVQRDGYLTIAHASGQFNGMETDIMWSDDGKTPKGAWCKVWNKSSDNPVFIKVYMDEYNTRANVWGLKPLTMIQKVAESQALRKAFNISGVYSEEEADSWNGTPPAVKEIPASEDDMKPATSAQIETLKALSKEELPLNMNQITAKKMIGNLTAKK